MRYVLTILLFVLVYPGFGQAVADGHTPRQHNPRQNRNIDLNNHPIIKARLLDKLKRTQERKVAFMTRQLDLTPTQSEKFWPVYNQYQDELTAALFERRQNTLNPQPNSQDKADELDTKIVTIRKRYRAEFRKILPQDKVEQLYKSEQEFNDEAMRQYKGQKDDVSN